MSQKFFITGSGTGVGKTLVTTSLAHQLRQQGKRVSVLKPVISGYTKDAENDTAMLLQSIASPVNAVTIEAVSPWRFMARLAPNVAATREGKEIIFSEVVDFCNVSRTSEITLIEGAGGVMSPLTESHTMLDLASALACPAIVVVGTYLGSISHALTACEALSHRKVPLKAVIVSESGEHALSALQVAAELKKFLPRTQIVPLPYVAGGQELWQHTADLTWML